MKSCTRYGGQKKYWVSPPCTLFSGTALKEEVAEAGSDLEETSETDLEIASEVEETAMRETSQEVETDLEETSEEETAIEDCSC